MASLKPDRIDDELLLNRLQRVVEQTRLAPMISEASSSRSQQISGDLAARCSEETFALGLVSLARVTLVESVG